MENLSSSMGRGGEWNLYLNQGPQQLQAGARHIPSTPDTSIVQPDDIQQTDKVPWVLTQAINTAVGAMTEGYRQADKAAEKCGCTTCRAQLKKASNWLEEMSRDSNYVDLDSDPMAVDRVLGVEFNSSKYNGEAIYNAWFNPDNKRGSNSSALEQAQDVASKRVTDIWQADNSAARVCGCRHCNNRFTQTDTWGIEMLAPTEPPQPTPARPPLQYLS